MLIAWKGRADGLLQRMERTTDLDEGRRCAVFVDRDGTLNEPVADRRTGTCESPLAPEDVRLIDGAADALQSIADAGYIVVCVSNQPAAAKGNATVETLLDVHERVVDLLAQSDAALDASMICLHHPGGVPGELQRDCECRKPQPGMLLEAATRLGIDLAASWMVGDSDVDVAAGQAAGCHTALVEHPFTRRRRSGRASPTSTNVNLAQAVQRIVGVSARGTTRALA